MSSDDKQPAAAPASSWAGRFDAWLGGLASAQVAGPWPFIVVAFVLGGLSLPLILGTGGVTDGLTLNSDFRAMLPDHAQSVLDLDEIQERFGGVQALMVAIEGPDEAAVQAFTRELAPRVEAMSDEQVVAVDWNISEFIDFVEENRHLYAGLSDLEELRDVLEDRIAHERNSVWDLGLDDDAEGPPDPEAVLERMREDAETARASVSRYPNGFLQHPDEPTVLMVVRTRIAGADAGKTTRLIRAIEAAAADLDAEGAGVQLHFGGTLAEVLEETTSLLAAVRNATLLTVSLVFLAIYAFFLRVRPIPLLGLSLVPPVLMTFGFAELTVDYLNASTAFLSSIVVGNGINPNVIWMARYFEERRAGVPLGQAVRRSAVGTWRGTLTAALAAGLAYGSLIVTDYRGFRDFGIIGGVGMVLCWIAAYALLPSLAVVWERVKPLTFKPTASRGAAYGVLFGRLALGGPKSVLAASAVLTAAAAIIVGLAIVNDPLEYDFRKLRSRRDPQGEIMLVRRASIAILNETQTGSSLAVLAPTVESIPRFEEQIATYAEEVDGRSVGELRSLATFLPDDQEAKIPVLAELRDAMLEVRPYLAESQQEQLDDQLPPETVVPLTRADVPDSVARTYTERDGTRGRLMFIEHFKGENPWDGQYIIRWARAARSLRAEGADGPPPVAGTAVVFADLSESVWRDGPRAVTVSLLATILLLLVTFRGGRISWLTLGALLVGILWMAGAMALLGMRLNFLNFVAFPITFGNGVDYAVNVMRRYAEERDLRGDGLGAIRAAVEETGGAVVLCSLTTVIGYISLYTSTNQALNSFGAAMAISEVTCLAAAVIALPALLLVLTSRGQATRPASDEPTADARPSRV